MTDVSGLRKSRIKTSTLKTNTPKKRQLEKIITKYGYTDFKWINPEDVVVAEWVRMKCRFGCDGYGRNASCPPNVPDVEECRRFFNSYSTGIIFHFAKKVRKPEERRAWSSGVTREMLKLERDIFLAGYYKVFLLPMDSCNLCAKCPGVRAKCTLPALARPTPEAMAVDVYATARQYGYPIEVLRDYSQTMNRYALLLIE